MKPGKHPRKVPKRTRARPVFLSDAEKAGFNRLYSVLSRASISPAAAKKFRGFPMSLYRRLSYELNRAEKPPEINFYVPTELLSTITIVPEIEHLLNMSGYRFVDLLDHKGGRTSLVYEKINGKS